MARSHGIKGEVVVNFSTDLVAERTAPGAELYIGGVAHTVRGARRHGRQHIVQLEGVGDRDAADALRGAMVEADEITDIDTVFVHEVIGRTVVDQHGTAHGEVVAVVDNPASDLMELADGRLVPFSFLVVVDDDTVEVDVPPGLLED